MAGVDVPASASPQQIKSIDDARHALYTHGLLAKPMVHWTKTTALSDPGRKFLAFAGRSLDAYLLESQEDAVTTYRLPVMPHDQVRGELVGLGLIGSQVPGASDISLTALGQRAALHYAALERAV